MKDMGDQPQLALGTYRHYKGGIYEVFGLACHTETLEWMVIYRSEMRKKQDMPSVWVRPYDMFIEVIELDGTKVPRFEKL